MNVPVPASFSASAARPFLAEAEWRERIRRHHGKVDPIVLPHLDRASRGVRHPVIDFLFQYYPFAPAHLRRWTPGIGVVLEGDAIPGWDVLSEARRMEAGWMIDPALFPERRRDAVNWVLGLLEKTAERPPRFGCFGLHEWAMVYRTPEVRHAGVPLRFSVEETARIVESQPVSCSHYDAFRFFTPAARPLNRLQPTLEKRQEMEQRGCLHVNMDLYKWASQFYPWISSDVLAEVFILACRIREMDMRASPYNLSSLGLAPIRIETEEGRAEYAIMQQNFAEEAVPLRDRLIGEFRSLKQAITPG